MCIPFRNSDLVTSIHAVGYDQCTHSQANMLPQLMSCRAKEVILQNASSTGKTVACLINMLNQIDVNKKYTQALFICASYPSALETGNLLTKMSMFMNISVDYAVSTVKTPDTDCQVIVGTPKEIVAYRILGTIKLENVSLVIFDDTDIVTTTHLIVDHLLMQLPTNCQKMFVTTTLNTACIQKLSTTATKFVTKNEILPSPHHYAVKCINKQAKLIYILDLIGRSQVVVFCGVRYFLHFYKVLYHRFTLLE